jgi:hypothetical protein
MRIQVMHFGEAFPVANLRKPIAYAKIIARQRKRSVVEV